MLVLGLLPVLEREALLASRKGRAQRDSAARWSVFGYAGVPTS